MKIAQGVLLILLSLPVLEIVVLIQVGSLIGLIPTLLLLFGAASLGTYLLQSQGLSVWQKVQNNLQHGELPALELIESALIAAGAVLLLIPGFLSDITALLCLIPLTRRMIAQSLLAHRFGFPSTMNNGTEQGPRTIEGEYRRED